jgi:dodecin
MQSGEQPMSNVYAISEIVGTSDKSIEDAIDQAIAVAGQTIRNLDWFEVSGLRGHLKDGRVAHYQVSVKLGFRYESKAG